MSSLPQSSLDPTTDLNQQVIRVAEDVLIWPVQELGETVYRIEIPKLHRFYRIGHREYVLMSMFDGRTRLPQACGLATAKLGEDAPTSDESLAIVQWLLRNEIVYLESLGPPSRDLAAKRASSSTIGKTLLSRWNPFWMKVPLPASERIIGLVSRRLGFLFHKSCVIAGVLLIASALVAVVFRWSEWSSETVELFQPNHWAWLLGIWLALKVVHELGHAVACHRLGGQVHACGLVFVLFAPLAYVDVTSCWRMPSKWARIAVAAAGMFVELCVAAIATGGYLCCDDPSMRLLCKGVVVSAGLSTVLFNANVLMRFDGYYMLTDLLDIPNLAAESSASLRRFARRWIVGEPTKDGQLQGWRNTFVITYGLAAFLWRIMVCLTLAITASTLFAGAGVVLSVLGITMWIGSPVKRLVGYLADRKRFAPLQFHRAVLVGGFVVAIATGIVFAVPIPTSIGVPVITQYAPNCAVRSTADGFVENVFVRDGQVVKAGERLVQLRNLELSHQVQVLELELAQNKIKMRQASRLHDEAAAQVLRQVQESVATRLRQLKTRESGLTLCAKHAGKVVGRSLPQRVGTYVREGDVVLVVADETDQEWITLVSQQDIQSLRGNVGNEVRLCTAGNQTFVGRLERIDPRATDELSEIALAATEGGTLAVSADPDDRGSLRLTQPHFRGRISMPDEAFEASTGSRSWAKCGYRSRTLAGWIEIKVREMLDQAHELDD